MTFRPINLLFHILLSSLISLAIVFCLAASVSAQTSNNPTRLLEGVVVDQTGAPVNNAEVIFSAQSNVLTRARTNEDGRFNVRLPLLSGITAVIEAAGFARARVDFNHLQTNPAPEEVRVVLTPAPISEHIIITATRTETQLGETAASVRVLSEPQLVTTAAITLDDTLRQVPGFSLFRRSGSRTANPTTQGVSLRGVGASGASRALVLSDLVPLNDPFGGWIYWSRIPRPSIETIEVVRGGASHLYGSAALGGIVQIVTRKPKARALSLELSYGNRQSVDASLYAGGRKGKWGASLAAAAFHTDGYVIVDERERGIVDTPAGARNSTIVLTVDRSISNNANVFMSASFFGESRANGTRLQINRTHIRQFITGGNWQDEEFGAFTLRAYGGTQVFDQTFSGVSQTRQTESLTRLQRVPAQSTGFSFQWSRPAWRRHTLVAGLEARAVRGTSDEQVYVASRVSSFVGAGGRERSLGIFAQDIISLPHNFIVTAGARFDRWRNFSALSTTRSLATGIAATQNFPSRAETAFSPHVSLLYKPLEYLSLYTAAARAFRAPTLNELYRSFRVGDALTLANENLLAERLTSVEGGASANTFNDKLNVRVTFFWSELTRPIANVTINVTPTLITRQRQNLGRTRSTGLELDFESRITDRFTISGGYLLADAVVRRFPANSLLEGLLIPQVPRHQFTFQARYLKRSLATIALQARASSSQFDDDQNRLRLDKYFTLDAYASRRLATGFDAFIAAENLFNSRYDVGLTPIRTIGPPLLFRLGFKFQLAAR